MVIGKAGFDEKGQVSASVEGIAIGRKANLVDQIGIGEGELEVLSDILSEGSFSLESLFILQENSHCNTCIFSVVRVVKGQLIDLQQLISSKEKIRDHIRMVPPAA